MNHTPRYSLQLRTLSAVALTLSASLTGAYAVDYVWDGGGDGVNWTDPSNWDLDSNFPNGAGDKATFSGTATEVSLTTDVLSSVHFGSAGWTISGNGDIEFDATEIVTSSASSGTNIFSNRLFINGNSPWDIGAGSTVVHTGILDNKLNINKSGAGTLILNSSQIGVSGSTTNTNGGVTLINYSTTKTINTFMQANGGVLGGSGSIVFGHHATNSYQLRINSSSGLNPGGDGTAEGGNIIGTFSVQFTDLDSGSNDNTLRFYDNSVFHVDIDAVSDTSDLLAISLGSGATSNGVIQFVGTAAILELETVGMTGLDPGDEFTIATYAHSPTGGDGTFGTVTLDGVDITSMIGDMYYLNYNSTSLVFGMIPEPSEYAVLLGLVCLGFVAYRRRKR